MELTVLAGSDCWDGNCPTFFTDASSGDVVVRGYDPSDPTGKKELDVRIPAANWALLVAQLPR